MARSFNGTSDLAGNTALALTVVDNLSFGLWLNPANLTQSNAIPLFVGDTSSGYGFNYTGGTAQLFLGGINFFAIHALTANVWQHVFVVCRAGQWVGYYNGSPANLTTTVPNAPVRGVTNSTLVGANSSGGGAPNRFFAGSLAEAACWNTTLSDQEVAALAAGRLPVRVRPASLASYWPLFGLSGASREPDLGGGASPLNLTLTGTAFSPHPPVTLFTRRAVNLEVILPEAPTGLAAVPGVGIVTLSWSSTTPSPVTYSVYRGTSPGGEALFDNGVLTEAYEDGDVVPGTTYYYRVSATDPGGEGPLSTEISAAVAAVGVPTLAGVAAGGVIDLSWGSVDGVSGYEVWRGGTLLSTVVGATSYDDTTATQGISYSYQVRGFVTNAAGTFFGDFSNAVVIAAAITTQMYVVSDTYSPVVEVSGCAGGR